MVDQATHSSDTMDNQGRWHAGHANIRVHDSPQLIQIDPMDIAGVMRRPCAIVPISGTQQQITITTQDAGPGSGGQGASTTGGGGSSAGSRSSGSSDDPKWEAEFLQLFWEEEKKRAQSKNSSKVRKKRIRTPEQKAIEAARKRMARAKEKETLTEAERLERNRKRRLRERMNRYRKLNKIPAGGAIFPGALLDMGAGSMQHHMDGKQV